MWRFCARGPSGKNGFDLGGRGYHVSRVGVAVPQELSQWVAGGGVLGLFAVVVYLVIQLIGANRMSRTQLIDPLRKRCEALEAENARCDRRLEMLVEAIRRDGRIQIPQEFFND